MQTDRWPSGHTELTNGPIRVQVETIEHLFSAIDPMPMRQRDLDTEIEDWMVTWAEELPRDHEIVLEVSVGDHSWIGLEEPVEAGIRNNFSYREWSTGRRLARLMRDGRISLVIGLAALIALTTAGRLIEAANGGTFLRIVEEGLGVAGWVAMWRPMEIFLYEWWPIRRERRIYRRLAAAVVVFSTAGDAGVPSG
ncbi:MAG: hypothetical protein ABIO83_07245 [Ilumatobacteraceae bacterium]